MPFRLKRIQTRDPVGLLIGLCWIVYFFAYWGRLNYSACLVEIVGTMGITKEQAGGVSSLFFLAYGMGQFIHGMLVEKTNPRYMLTGSLILTALVNAVFPLLPSLSAMRIAWLINGIAQSALWAGIIRMYTLYIPADRMSRAIVLIHTTGAAGTLFVYILSALCVAIVSWKAMFILSGAVLALAATLWYRGLGSLIPRLTVQTPLTQEEGGPKPQNTFRLLIATGAIVAFVMAIANGALRDGTTMWVPSYLHEKFDADAAFSIFITLVLPLFGIAGSFLSRMVLKRIPNPLLAAVVFFVAALGSIVCIYLWGSLGLLLCCVLFGFVSCSMSAVNTLVVSVLPLSLREYGGRAATVAGVVNAFCYVGSTGASYALGAVADRSGWDGVLIALLLIAAAAIVLGTAGALKLRRFQARRQAVH